MNRYQAEIIMKLPDGYNYEFSKTGKYIYGDHQNNRDMIIFEINGDKVTQVEVGKNEA